MLKQDSSPPDEAMIPGKNGASAQDIKFVRSLQQKKFRQQNGLFVVEGKKMVEELLRSPFEIHSIYTAGASFKIPGPAPVIRTKDGDLERMSSFATSPGVLAVVKQKEWKPLEQLTGLSLVLDGMSDPGNMGTIIRTADWFGVEQILCSANCVELWNAKVVQATMGSVFRMPVVYGALPELLKSYIESGKKLVAATMQGTSFQAIEKSFPALLAIGSEANGLSAEVLALATTQISIPGRGKTESLNAGVAAGILMQQLMQ
ncbi:MAG: RNA methyltransferase [Flavobacteriales bacterium]|nr:RNA methyltransferase [Flavobacteriales bacterium]